MALCRYCSAELPLGRNYRKKTFCNVRCNAQYLKKAFTPCSWCRKPCRRRFCSASCGGQKRFIGTKRHRAFLEEQRKENHPLYRPL